MNLNSTSLETSYRWKYVHSKAVWWLINSVILWKANITYLVSYNRLIIYVYKILFLACWECGRTRMPFKHESKSTPFRKILKDVGQFRQCTWQSRNIAVFWDVITCRLSSHFRQYTWQSKNIAVFWDVITCRLSEIYCRFLRVCSFHLQGRRLSSLCRNKMWDLNSYQCWKCSLFSWMWGNSFLWNFRNFIANHILLKHWYFFYTQNQQCGICLNDASNTWASELNFRQIFQIHCLMAIKCYDACCLMRCWQGNATPMCLKTLAVDWSFLLRREICSLSCRPEVPLRRRLDNTFITGNSP